VGGGWRTEVRKAWDKMVVLWIQRAWGYDTSLCNCIIALLYSITQPRDPPNSAIYLHPFSFQHNTACHCTLPSMISECKTSTCHLPCPHLSASASQIFPFPSHQPIRSSAAPTVPIHLSKRKISALRCNTASHNP